MCFSEKLITSLGKIKFLWTYIFKRSLNKDLFYSSNLIMCFFISFNGFSIFYAQFVNFLYVFKSTYNGLFLESSIIKYSKTKFKRKEKGEPDNFNVKLVKM